MVLKRHLNPHYDPLILDLSASLRDHYLLTASGATNEKGNPTQGNNRHLSAEPDSGSRNMDHREFIA